MYEYSAYFSPPLYAINMWVLLPFLSMLLEMTTEQPLPPPHNLAFTASPSPPQPLNGFLVEQKSHKMCAGVEEEEEKTGEKSLVRP